MGTFRVASNQRGRLTRIALSDVELRIRQQAARTLREKAWRDDLDPTRFDGPVSMRERLRVLALAVDLERVALRPSPRRYVLPEDAVERVLGG